MTELTNEIINDIAVQHGVRLGKDDPILMLHTINQRLIDDSKKAQAEILAQFKTEIEQVSQQWKDDAKEKAEKILNRSLSSSKEVMAKTLCDATIESTTHIKKLISDSMTESLHTIEKAKKISHIALLASGIALSGLLFNVLMIFFR